MNKYVKIILGYKNSIEENDARHDPVTIPVDYRPTLVFSISRTRSVLRLSSLNSEQVRSHS